MGKPAGNSRATALIAHKSTDLDAWERVVANTFGELVVGNNFSSASLSYNADDTISQLDITKNIDGSSVTIRYAFTYTSGNLTGVTKTTV